MGIVTKLPSITEKEFHGIIIMFYLKIGRQLQFDDILHKYITDFTNDYIIIDGVNGIIPRDCIVSDAWNKLQKIRETRDTPLWRLLND